MNPFLKARNDALEALKSEAVALQQLDGIPTEAQTNRVKALPGEIAAAKAAVEAAKAMNEAQAEAEGFMAPGTIKAVSANGEERKPGDYVPSDIKLMVDQEVGRRMQFVERVGSETYGRDRMGRLKSLDSSGFGLSESTYKAISEPSYKASWELAMRRAGKNVPDVDIKALLPGLDADGGWLAPPEYVAELIRRDPYPTEILSKIRTVPCGRDKVVWPRETAPDSDTADIYASPVRMKFGTDQGSSAEIDPTFGNAEIPINTAIFPIQVNRNLLEDSAIPLSAIVMESATEAYDLGLDNYIMTGTGNTQPMGLLTNAGGAGFTLPTQNIGNLPTADGLSDLMLLLPPQYRANFVDTCFVTSAANDAYFAKLKDTSGQYIWGLMRDNGPGGMVDMRVRKAFGWDIVYSAFMPSLAGNANVALFGNLKKTYIYCQRMGLTVFPVGDQDYSLVTGNKVAFVFRIRGGGEIVQNRASHVGVAA